MNHLTTGENVGGILTKESDGSSEKVSGFAHGLVIPHSDLIVESELVKIVLQSQVVVLLDSTKSLTLGDVAGNVGTGAIKALESRLGFKHPTMCRTKRSSHRRHSDRSVGGSDTDFVGVRHDVSFIPFLVCCVADVVCVERKSVCEDFLETVLDHGGRHPKGFDASDSHSGCTTGEWPSQIHSEVTVVSDDSDLNTTNIESLHPKLLANETKRIRNLRVVDAHLFCSFLG